MHSFTHPTTARIAAFLEEIGIEVIPCELPEPGFLPGVLIERGRMLVDESLLNPGDLLHEAGHLAVMTTEERAERRHNVGKDMGEEIGAICWSYAALVHLGLDPEVVFHPNGYKGQSQGFIQTFREGHQVGVPLLQWMGLTLDEKNARNRGLPAYPAMLRWLRE